MNPNPTESAGAGDLRPPLHHDFPRSQCPIATTLDMVGDRWSLVVVRDLLAGRERFGELSSGPEKIPTNILSDRLHRLREAGLVTREPYCDRPRRYAYRLTRAGRALHPVLQAICRWANAHVDGTWAPPAWFMDDDR